MSLFVKDDEFAQKSQGWCDLRACFMTASQLDAWRMAPTTTKYKNALSKKEDHVMGQPSKDVIEGIAQRAMAWGNLNEDVARNEYVANELPDTYRIDTGVHIMLDEGMQIAASPDGLVYDGDTLVGVLEIKCPVGQAFVSNTTMPVQLNIQDLRDKVKITPGAKYSIGALQSYSPSDKTKNFNHYCQCLANLFISGAQWIDYMVWTPPRNKWATEKEEHQNYRVTRLRKDDEAIQKDWKRLKEELDHGYAYSHMTFTNNLTKFMEKYSFNLVTDEPSIKRACTEEEKELHEMRKRRKHEEA